MDPQHHGTQRLFAKRVPDDVGAGFTPLYAESGAAPAARREVRAHIVGLGIVLIALAVTRLTWPLLERTPFVLLFAATFIAAHYGTEGSGLIAILVAAFGAAGMIPGPPHPAISIVVFVTLAFVANRFVAARHRAEAALQSSEAQLRVGWDQAAIGCALLNRHGQVERLNPAMQRLLDFPGPAWVGVSIGYFCHPDDSFAERERFRELMTSNLESYQIEQRYRRRDGTFIWGRVTMSAVRSDEGTATGALMMLEDVTSRKLAEENLRASEEEFRGLFEGVPVGLFRSTAGGRFLAANPALLAMLGYEAVAALESVTLSDLFADSAAQGALRTALATHDEEIRSVETILRRDDGRRLTVVMTARAVRDRSGAITYYEGSMLDLTDRLDLERQLLQAQKHDALGRMVGGVVHDFSNLLTAIGGYTELALHELAPDARRSELEEILNVSHRAAALTRQLVRFSRGVALDRDVINLNDVIQSVGTLVRRLAGDQVDVTLDLAADLSAVRGNAGQIEQVLVNLAVNARDAMPKGGRLTIETANVIATPNDKARPTHVPAGQYVRLAVSDTGCGMDESTKAQLFQPFFTTKDPGKGSGLGLATVEGIVKRAGGYIRVYSEPDKGTTFRIYFPRLDAAEWPDMVSDRSVSTRPDGAETVLLVEDDDTVRQVAQAVLRNQGYDVLEASSGEEGRKLAMNYPGKIDLVFTDVVMPGVSGPTFVNDLRTSRPQVKVLFTSGYTRRVIERSGALDRNALFLEKPFTPDELARAVRAALS